MTEGRDWSNLAATLTTVASLGKLKGMNDHEKLLQRIYDAFNRREIDTVLAAMNPGLIGQMVGREAASMGVMRCAHTGPGNGPQWILRLFRLGSNTRAMAESAFAFSRRSETYQAT